jgi:GntR family transcriptional regulator/MocR family aminotransferase
VAHLPASAHEPTVIAAALARGVGLYGMSAHRSTAATDPPQLVLGFGNLTERAISEGIALIGNLL